MSELRDEELDALFGKAALTHLTDEELGLYHDGADDAFRRALTAAHLSRCLICTKRFDVMQHTLATYHELAVSPESVAQLKALLTPSAEARQPPNLSERLRALAARLVERAREMEQKILVQVREVQVPVVTPAFARGERKADTDLHNLVVQGADERYRFLTVLDEDEAGELYLFISIYGEQKGAVYCWPVEDAQVQLPFIPDKTERHRYQAYLTDRAVPVPEDIRFDLNINDEAYSEERRQIVAAFLAALEKGEISYRANEVEVRA